MRSSRGIEVGHVFALGTVYSKAMGATFLDAAGQPQPMRDGLLRHRHHPCRCRRNRAELRRHGHHLARTARPFTVAIAPIGYDRSDAVRAAADQLHDELESAGIEVLLDDRGERPGVMFADLELIGIPHRITIGDRGLKDGKVEYQARRDTQRRQCRVADAVSAAAIEASLLTMLSDPRRLSSLPRFLLAPASCARRRAGRGSAGGQRAELAAPFGQRLSGTAPGIRHRRPKDGPGSPDMASRLAKKMPDWPTRRDFLITVQYEATRAGLDPQLVLGLIQHESNFRKYAVLERQARGYMQVMPFWVTQDRHARSRPVQRCAPTCATAVRSCAITSIVENGDYFRALGRYNGSLGQARISERVIGLMLVKWRGTRRRKRRVIARGRRHQRRQ